jgi:hypothetical protein
MRMKKLRLVAAAVGALGFAAVASSASAALIIPVGTTGNPYFYLTSGTPFTPSITAVFGHTISTPGTAFDDEYTFTIPQNGTGSGNLSTSFSSQINRLDITNVLINGVSYAGDIVTSATGQSLVVGGIPIVENVLNTIEVIGTTNSGPGFTGAFYDGGATFSAAVPEPATWITMIAGLGLVGASMRRRRASARFA